MRGLFVVCDMCHKSSPMRGGEGEVPGLPKGWIQIAWMLDALGLSADVCSRECLLDLATHGPVGLIPVTSLGEERNEPDNKAREMRTAPTLDGWARMDAR